MPFGIDEDVASLFAGRGFGFWRDDQPDVIWRGEKKLFTCPTATLLCDSIAASKTKCGFRINHGGTCYTNAKTTVECDFADDTYSDPVSCNNYYLVSHTVVKPCEASGCTGSIGYKFTLTEDCGTPVESCDGDTIVCGETTYACDPDASNGAHNFTSGNHSTTEQTLSVEYTTADLIANTVAALPAYAGFAPAAHSLPGQATTCSAIKEEAADETSYSIRRFKYKFTISPEACAGMVVKWKTRFIPSISGTPDSDPSHWTLTDKNWPADGGETETDVFEEDEPSSNGTLDIVNVSVDCSDCPEMGGGDGG